MATFNWSTLTSGQVIVFDPSVDVLNFNDAAISAALVSLSFPGGPTTVSFSYGGKTITLNTALYTLTTTNVTFANGSQIIIGDNTTGTVDDDGPNTLVGGLGDDQLIGGGGNDQLRQTPGADYLDGGDDSDRLVFADTGITYGGAVGVSVNLAAGTSDYDTGDGANPIGTLVSIENVNGTAGNDSFVGGDPSHDADIFGNRTPESFRPLAGNDTITGATGVFSTRVDYSTNTAAQPVNVNLGTGEASDGMGGTDTLVRVDQVFGGEGNDVLFGGSLERSASSNFLEVFRGDAGDDTIDGAGTDTVLGAAGSDRVVYSNSPAPVIVNLSASPFDVGFDTVPGGTARDGFGFTDTLLNIDQVEGSANDDTLVGGANHRLIGGAGDDLLVGAASGVEVSYQNASGPVNVSLAIAGPQAVGADQGIDTLVKIDGLRGGDFSDILTGNAASNTITGNGGADTIDGGPGIDFAAYWSTPLANGGVNAFIANGSGSVDDGMGSIDTLTNIEGLIGSHANDTLTGGAGDQWFRGRGGDDMLFAGDGADTLNGGDGNDTLVGYADVFDSTPDVLDGGSGDDILYGEASDSFQGGAGRDLLYIVNSNPVTIDLASTGIEWIQTDFGDDVISGFTQTLGIEVYSDGGNDSITGSFHNDIIWSGSGDDLVYGGDGDDVIVADIGSDTIGGGLGNDSLYVDSSDTFFGDSGFDALYITGGAGMAIDMVATNMEWAADFVGGDDTIDGSTSSVALEVYAAGGTDVVTGGFGVDFLWGGAGDDAVSGNAGDDTLVGETGMDILAGGLGVDALYGNSGNGGDGVLDTFVFGDDWGTDFVFDFDNGVDRLDVSAVTGPNSFADLSVTNTADGHAYVTFGGNLIAVANASGQIDASDFIF